MSRRLAFSASKLQRIIRCPASAALPQANELGGQYAKRGQSIHDYIEAAKRVGREEALASVPDELRALCDSIPDDILKLDLAHEVAFVFDLATGEAREVGRGIGRHYGDLSPTEIPGTMDVVGIIDEYPRPRRVLVEDYKTGHGWLPPAARSAQLRFGVLAAARAYGADGGGIGRYRRINEYGDPWTDEADYSPEDLAEFEELLFSRWSKARSMAEQLERGVPPDTSEGPWCRYCPAQVYCPAKQALARAAVDGTELQQLVTEAHALEPHELGRIYLRAKAARDVVNKLLGQCRAQASITPLPLGDGRWLGEKTKKGNEQLDADVAFEVLEERCGRLAAFEAMKISATKKGLEKVVRSGVPRGKGKAAVEEVLEEVRRRGGAKCPQKTDVIEFDGEPELTDGATRKDNR